MQIKIQHEIVTILGNVGGDIGIEEMRCSLRKIRREFGVEIFPQSFAMLGE